MKTSHNKFFSDDFTNINTLTNSNYQTITTLPKVKTFQNTFLINNQKKPKIKIKPLAIPQKSLLNLKSCIKINSSRNNNKDKLNQLYNNTKDEMTSCNQTDRNKNSFKSLNIDNEKITKKMIDKFLFKKIRNKSSDLNYYKTSIDDYSNVFSFWPSTHHNEYPLSERDTINIKYIKKRFTKRKLENFSNIEKRINRNIKKALEKRYLSEEILKNNKNNNDNEENKNNNISKSNNNDNNISISKSNNDVIIYENPQSNKNDNDDHSKNIHNHYKEYHKTSSLYGRVLFDKQIHKENYNSETALSSIVNRICFPYVLKDTVILQEVYHKNFNYQKNEMKNRYKNFINGKPKINYFKK